MDDKKNEFFVRILIEGVESGMSEPQAPLTPSLLTRKPGTKIKGLGRTVFEIIAVLCRETVVPGGGFGMRRVVDNGGTKLHVVGPLSSSFGSSSGKV